MASSMDGKFIFIAVLDVINVYKIPEFSSKTPPNPSTIFPFTPFKVFRPTATQFQKIRARCAADNNSNDFAFNHVRSGWIGGQESLMAVGEFGTILVWNLGNFEDEPILLEPADFFSTWGIAMSRNSNLLATSSNSHSITIFHFPTRKIIYHDNMNNNTILHENNIPSLDFSPCGRHLVSCSIDGDLILWSLEDGQVKKMKSTNQKWGWLVRFVPSQRYDQRTSGSNEEFRKSYYNSGVKEVPYDSDDEDILAPYYNVLENILIDHSEEDDDSLVGDQLEEDEIADTYEDERFLELTSGIDFHSLSSYNNFTVMPAGPVHLSEGAADTWPEDDEASEDEIDDDDDEEDYDDYEDDEADLINSDLLEILRRHKNDDSDDDYMYELDSDEYPDDMDVLDEPENAGSRPVNEADGSGASENYSDASDYDSEIDSEYYSDDSDYYSDDEEEDFSELELEIEQLKIDLNIKMDNINKISTPTPPLDIFFCTSTSLSVISFEGLVKCHISNLKRTLLSNQTNGSDPTTDNFMRFFPDRLGMGEWIDDLGLFLVVDNYGHIYVSSPKTTTHTNEMLWSLDLGTTLLIPDTLNYQSEAVGYTLIRREDEEFGIKLHLYMICSDGTIKIYEIIKACM